MNRPKIRFKGYTDAWEQRKLGELCEVTMGQSPDGSTYSDEPSDYILVQGNADLKDGWVFPRIWTTQKTKTAQAGDLIMSVRAPAGAMGKTAYDVVLGRGVAGIKGNEFVYQTLVKFDSDGYWKKLAAGSTFESVNSDAVKGAILLVPQDVEEQEKIGQYFSHLDRLITLHQRKCEQTKKLKKFMLQKMFPQNGSSVPEIRFSGFTDVWEQRKLGELAEYRRGSFPQPYGNKDWYDGEGAMPFVQVADVTDEMNLVADTKQKISKLAQPMSVYADKNSVLVTLQGSIGRVAITQYGAFVDRTVLIFEKYKKEIDYIFFAYIIKQKFIEEARKAPGGTIKTITKEALSDFALMLPDYKEQMKIGQYLQSLDHLITLHQRKCDELQFIKKFMLQNMFV